jgi:rfaE bifunctional protein kinase chain/domain
MKQWAPDSVLDEIGKKAPAGARIVFVSGDFNVLHPGHLRFINFAADCGDFLVVGVNEDGRGHTLLPESLRCEGVRALSAVGHAFILKEPVENFILRLKPAVVVKGAEFHQRDNVEKSAVETYGGKLLFSSGDAHDSYADLLREEFSRLQPLSARAPEDYRKRHCFTHGDLARIVRKFQDLRVVVIGDLIVDEYTDCEPLGMSREDPTIVVSPILSRRFIGGAGIVAAHARGLGASVKYFSVAGEDAAAEFAQKQLEEYGVECLLAYDMTRPTTLKQRYRAENKTLLRVSHLRQHAIDDELANRLAEQVEAALEDASLLIFSDFNYGCLPQPLVERLAAFCAARDIPMAADSQTSSQIGDVSRFQGMMLLTPTEHEARLAMRDSQSGLVVLADALRTKAAARHVVVTLASEGVLIHSPTELDVLPGDRLPAFNLAPRDVSGAGDSLLTATSMALACGADIWRSAYLGSLVAACQVRRIGNIPTQVDEILAELSQ